MIYRLAQCQGSPAEVGLGLNEPETMSPRLEEEFPLDLLQRYKTITKSSVNVEISSITPQPADRRGHREHCIHVNQAIFTQQ